jgi:hypothetical protein
VSEGAALVAESRILDIEARMEPEEAKAYRRTRLLVWRVVSEGGVIESLPLLFEGNLLCPACLVRGALVVSGWWYRCGCCGFGCAGSVVATEQGLKWLRLNDGKVG